MSAEVIFSFASIYVFFIIVSVSAPFPGIFLLELNTKLQKE